MKPKINETHDPEIESWVESANKADAEFPIQNLPFGIFKTRGNKPRIGVAIGDYIANLPEWHGAGLLMDLDNGTVEACLSSSLNSLMSLGPDAIGKLRLRLSRLLRADDMTLRNDDKLVSRLLVPMAEAQMMLPVRVGDYTDFYASIFHAKNVGSMFRPDNPLLPNYEYVPVAYHGRASSIVVSGTPVTRPCGQIQDGNNLPPSFGPSKLLDYELEVGFFVGHGNDLGKSIPIEQAEQHIFGLCLLNDWSARDIQKWEYQPLGPFLGKSFATTVSPWIVTMEALAPYRIAAFERAHLLPHLSATDDRQSGGIDLTVEAFIYSQQMRDQGEKPFRLSQGNLKDMYWTIGQMVAHHTSNGCNLQPGDLLATGTVSGETKPSRGCLLELSRQGAEPIPLPNGEAITFLRDGDEIILRGYCASEKFKRIGVGECRGRVCAAVS